MARIRQGALALIAFLIAGPALAHPHVFVTAKAEMVFSGGQLTAVRHIWQFDEAFSAYAIQGLDANNDGALTRAELAPLAQVNVDSLADYGFFTWLSVDGEQVAFAAPSDYFLDIYHGQLTLFFTLPLAIPAPIIRTATLDVFDPEYFVAYEFVTDAPITLVDPPLRCSSLFYPPPFLDPATAMALAAIPADERILPADLAGAAADLANTIVVTCGG
ncbi:MAG: DUF1007 family protein [Bauldia sp.]|nr:DUF1007 family protein [Bauldia sp.]MCW5716548.1 DUF1007 family protein [Bauldia sp.]